VNRGQAGLVLIKHGEGKQRFVLTAGAMSLRFTESTLTNVIFVSRMMAVRGCEYKLLFLLDIFAFIGDVFYVKQSRGTLSFQNDISSILKKERGYQQHTALKTNRPYTLPVFLSG